MTNEEILKNYHNTRTYISKKLVPLFRIGLFNKERASTINDDIMDIILSNSNDNEVQYDVNNIDDVIREYICNTNWDIEIEISDNGRLTIENLNKIFERISNILSRICALRLLGYDTDSICKYLNEPEEEINYAIVIIKKNNIINWEG
jgi:hypothetical protein